MNSETKICQNCKNKFTIEPEDFEFYEKIKVPAPTFCPECRMVRRMMFRNERALYKRKCDVSGHGEEILSIYSPDKILNVYDQKHWWSDEWDSLVYGRKYDFSKPFFQQYKELRDNFPLMSVSNSNAVNSDYCNVNDQSKDCYLISASEWNEKVMYSNRITHDKDSSDLYVSSRSELCYENTSCKENYRLFFGIKSYNCSHSYFLYDCRNCQNCFGCANLRNKKYCIFNEQYTKEEYEKRLKEFNLSSFNTISNLKNAFNKIYLKAIHKYANIVKGIDILGDNIDGVKNCQYCFDVSENTEDCKYINWAGYVFKDSYDGGPGVGGGGELMYETSDTGIQSSKIFSTSVVYGCHNVQYAFNCYNSSNLFGCIGLRNKQYCILNKQYTKEEYEQLVPKIIEHMNNMPYIDKKGRVYKYGEFFPPELSPFSYNETIAQEYFPLTKEQAIEQGYSWKEPEVKNFQFSILNSQLPDNIKDVKDDILNQIIQCGHYDIDNKKIICNEQCTTAFKIIPQELEFYRKMNLPLPRLCPNCRHYQRIKQRNPLKLWHRQCMCEGKESGTSKQELEYKYQNTIAHTHGNQPCPNEFETTYAPERKEIVYCEACYNQEVA